MALLPGSPAIDAGNNALIPAGITTDQRGLARVVNGTVDIGAFESSGFTLAVTGGNNQSTMFGTAFPNALQVTVTPNRAGDPVNGGVVTFTPPPSGATATLSPSGSRHDRLGRRLGHGDGQRHRGRPVQRHGLGHGGLAGVLLPE